MIREFLFLFSIFLAISGVIFLLFLYNWIFKRKSKLNPEIPLVSPLPLLGCSIHYRLDTVGFLQSCKKNYGNIFCLNLAGTEVILCCDEIALQKYHSAPEDVLSSRGAVADMGFMRALGPVNVEIAPPIHRHLIKNQLVGKMDFFLSDLAKQASNVINKELPNNSGTFDLIPTFKSIGLQIFLNLMISPDLLTYYPKFITEYNEFEEMLEDAIGKAVVLPPLVSNYFLNKVENKRKFLVKTIQDFMNQTKNYGFYLKILSDYQKENSSTLSLHCVAEFVVGFLFAVHKNLSIALAQTLSFLLQDPKSEEDMYLDIKNCFEADDLETSFSFSSFTAQLTMKKLAEFKKFDCCLKETLRMISHSIGSMRKVERDFELTDKITLKKGSYIGASHILMSLDSNVWEYSNLYDPDRFLRTIPKNYYIPFSSGTHACPGQQIASTTIKVLMLILLIQFQFQLPKVQTELTFERATLAQRKGPFMLNYSRRKNGFIS